MGCGTLLQIVSYGVQDVYLTGNPEMSHFKSCFKRHTNFSIESIELGMNKSLILPKCPGIINSKNNIYSCIINNIADLVYKLTLEIELTINCKNDYKFIKRPGLNLIDYVELQIGGMTIDKLYSEWINIWSQLNLTYEQNLKFNRLVDLSLKQGTFNTNKYKLYIPLPFFFTKHPSLSIPLLALKYNEVRVNVTFKNTGSILNEYKSDFDIDINNLSMYGDYIFLDKDEKKKYYDTKLEYIIEQVQRNTFQFKKNKHTCLMDLHFNNPIKQIVFICQDSKFISDTTNYLPHCYSRFNDNGNFVKKARLLFDNLDRFKERSGDYFRLVQPLQFNSFGSSPLSHYNKDETGYFYAYSFALSPEDYRHTGSCNFSFITNPQLELTTFKSEGEYKNVRVYAIGYNILEICNNMGSLVFC